MSSANEPHMLSEQACPQQFLHRELGAHTVAGVRPESKVQGIIDLLDNVYRTGETFLGNELMMQLERDASGTLQHSYFNFVYQPFRAGGAPAGTRAFAFEVTDLVHARQALEKVRDASAQAFNNAATA